MKEYQRVTGDMDLVKRTNRGHILNQLKLDGALSRAELSRKTGLSRSTCSALVDELLAAQLVVELGKDRSSGGRRPTLVDINYTAGRAIGIKVMPDSVVGALVDLTGKVLEDRQRTFSADDGHRACVSAVADTVAALSRSGSAGTTPILGIGIGMGGRIDYHTGTLLESSILPWRNLPFASLVEEKTGIPVYLENDVNTFALGENHFGAGKPYRDYLCITLGQGIGAGIVIDDRLYKGAHHGAGEFGHTKIVAGPEARRCTCGEYGCLEAYASTPAILADARERIAAAVPDGIGDTAAMEALGQAARNGDSRAAAVFEDAGRQLGIGLSTMVNVFDPEVILVGGEGTAYADLLEPAFRDALRENTVYSLADEIPVIVLPYEPDMWARGLAAMVMMERLQVAF